MQLKRFLMEEDGVGVIEVVLILVVLIGLVIVFKTQINKLLTAIFTEINKQAKDEVPGRDYGFSESDADMCAVACPGTCGIGENGGSETVSSDGIGFGGVIGDELL